MKSTFRRALRSSMIVSLMAWAFSMPVSPAAAAAVFNVTTNADTNDGSCDLDNCSLREAVIAANALAGVDTIFVPAGEYILSLGALAIDSEVTIEAVDGTAIIDGDGKSRVFEVSSAGNATLKELLITGGQADFGGGINNAGTTNVVSSSVSGNHATYGGGLYNAESGATNISNTAVENNVATNEGGGILNDGTFTLQYSTVSTNTATHFEGGGIGNTGTLTLTGSTVYGNGAPRAIGGGVYSIGDGVVTEIRSSTVSGNSALLAGGGIYNSLGYTELRATMVSDNTVSADSSSGGGIYNDGTLKLNDSVVSGNRATNSGGGIRNFEKTINGGDVAIFSSTVSGNFADYGGGVYNELGRVTIDKSLLKSNISAFGGGGFYNLDGSAFISSSTLSANESGGSGGGIYQISGELVAVANSTISENTSDADQNNAGDGGGILSAGGPSAAGVEMSNSILVGNQDPPGNAQHPNCSGTLKSAGYNIIGNSDGCEITLESTDSSEELPLLPLASNGGPTETYALPAGSNAIDHGPKDPSCTNGTDQRGVPRKGTCDTGAYELALCGSVVINVVGTDQGDTLSGTSSRDGILAMGGADDVHAKGGADSLCGGGGDDRLFGGPGEDRLLGAEGNDLLNGGTGADRCSGGPGKNKYVSC